MPPDADSPTSARGRASRLLAGLAARPAILLLLSALCAPLALAAFSSPAAEDDEDAEGRELTAPPDFPATLSALAEFPARFEAFFDDQFPLRLPLVKLSAEVRFRVFGISPNPAVLVLVGQDGWFYEGPGKERVQGETVRSRDPVSDQLGLMAYSDAELAHFARVLEERRVYLAERGTRFLFALAPSKRMIYPEHLPEALKRLKRETRMEQLARYLEKHSRVPVVDLTTALLAARGEPERPLLFYKTDGHWNYYGAFVAYRALVDGANRAFGDVLGPPLDLARFDVKLDQDWWHPRFRALMGVKVKEPYVRLVAHDDNPLAALHFTKGGPFRQLAGARSERADGVSLGREGVGGVTKMPERSLSRGERRRRYRYVAGPASAPLGRLLVFGDSFVEKCFYYFAAHARETYGYREILGFPSDLVEGLKPELAIQVIVQSYLLIEPPENPDAVTQAYLRVKHGESKRELLKLELEAGLTRLPARLFAVSVTERSGRLRLELPAFDAPGEGPLVVAVESGGATRIHFERGTKASRGSRGRERRVTTDATSYLELDPRDARRGGSLVFDQPLAALNAVRVSVRQLEP